LTFFNKISDIAPKLLRDGGWVFVEIAYGQSAEVARIFSSHGAAELLVKKDLSNIERVVRARFFSERTG
jgi:methylase of polypeptide subunit release factors